MQIGKNLPPGQEHAMVDLGLKVKDQGHRRLKLDLEA